MSIVLAPIALALPSQRLAWVWWQGGVLTWASLGWHFRWRLEARGHRMGACGWGGDGGAGGGLCGDEAWLSEEPCSSGAG